MVNDKLDIELMKKGASYLIGKHNFTALRATQCQSLSPIKTISNIEIIKKGNCIEIYVSAISFLHHMVRNIVGNLLYIGKSHWPPEKIQDILNSKDRTKGGPTAPAKGLYFLKVDY